MEGAKKKRCASTQNDRVVEGTREKKKERLHGGKDGGGVSHVGVRANRARLRA